MKGLDWGGKDQTKTGAGGGAVETYLGFHFSSFNPLPAEGYVPVKQFSLKTIVPKTMCSGKAILSEDYSPKDYV